ncbi:50S ribosomal protein L23 [Candidatus Gottesmanbacteria bacterium RIFCSPLOWO2_01_FULL_48_11]|uniref:Large ribosomal subunit protein uL23 n=2 Tax=Candidatus Gottesmaniibacteriota TaxID=1752720 RepID=A0A0G1UNT6_9BACT|nr:MAG: 50S ribosomal protein L23 [Candidatus Gottesmanbacteria bacterium GW2011_GWA1_48_13]OGG26594.1 MAG: 50S ribosomal protein L23 [Candidatus Gottesmanbacteria bacterium RIFCSPLOWO2_01_FULL_48_11]
MKQIVIKPLLTEKTLSQTGRGWYGFVVATHATKGQIAEQIANLYKVNVVGIRTARMHGKARRSGRRQTAVVRPDWKKAHVRLAKGQKIDAFEVSAEGAK